MQLYVSYFSTRVWSGYKTEWCGTNDNISARQCRANDTLYLQLKGLSFKRNQIQLVTVALMALSILASQMFSTILISDMGNVIIRSRNVSQMVHYHKERGSPFWLNLETSPSEYSLFARKVITRHFVVEGNKSSPSLSDSRIVLRAFFLLRSQECQSLSFYSGPSSVAELHYLCFPPELNYNSSSYKTPSTPQRSFELGDYKPPVDSVKLSELLLLENLAFRRSYTDSPLY